MAKQIIVETGYTFTPSTRTIVIPKYINRERLILITNVTKNQVIYNFSDPSMTATTYNASVTGATGSTTIVLQFNTSAMSSTDKLQIVIDEIAERIEPAETYLDPTNKMRVTTPQALIDTDFEYGIQQTKWENLGMVNNRPYSYPIVTPYPGITAVTFATSSRTVTITTSTNTTTATAVTASSPAAGFATYTVGSNTGFAAGKYVTITGASVSGYNGTFLISAVSGTSITVFNSTTGAATFSSGQAVVGVGPVNGTPITMQDSYFDIANGNYIIESGGGTGSFTYTAQGTNTTSITNILDPNKTLVYIGQTYTSAAIGSTPTWSFTGNLITATTTVPHGLAIGNEIAVVGTTATTNAPNGSFSVATITSPTSFKYYASATPTGTIAGGQIFVRPTSAFLHRPFDGGVIFSTNAQSNFQQATRQTRRYFRYQSGKGLQVSSGTILKPNMQIDSMTSVGSTVTVQTKDAHNMQPGSQITITGANEAEYNGTFTVNDIISYNTFKYTALSTPSASPASGEFYAAVSSWYGAVSRLGAFDSQNGLFYEFDGQAMYACKRNSTFQLAGRLSVTNGSNTVSQTNAAFPTFFAKQLTIGDYIVIRGLSYRVIAIASDISMTISPSYRGATASYVQFAKTVDTRIPQSQWNLDKMDGTGPSGINLDLSKMQMFYIDYSWYGAGFVRYGFRAANGNVTYVHKMVNNNVNTEAYMRSGNLPARYESITQPMTTTTTSTIGSTDGSINCKDTSKFPSTGTILVYNGSTVEYMNYSGKTATSFTGITRAQAGATANVTIAQNSNIGTVASATGIQVGQRVISSAFPDGTFVSQVSGTQLVFSYAATSANPTSVVFAPMSGTGQTFTYSATAPTGIDFAWPTYAPALSHWGTSVIMDGRYDDDKSLIFTYGQTGFTTIPANSSRALFSIRVAPSVDNGLPGFFGERELVNRMQLVLRSLDVSTSSGNANYLVRAYLNAIPTGTQAWTNAVGNVTGIVNSSLSQIADYGSSGTTVYGGEVTAGFFSQGTSSIDLSAVRDLGNAILGGGTSVSNTGIYPDGPDTLTIVITNLSTSQSLSALGRLSWTEAQA